ncbi:MAG: hypothetical protein R3B72_17090 [Polyangiaceae bacterium]
MAQASAFTPAQSGGFSIQAPSALADIEGDGYVIKVADVEVKGGEGEIVVIVEAKEGFKVNADYPHKVKFEDPPAGIELAKKKLSKDDGAFEGKKAFKFKGKVKATKDGTLKGEVKTSVCNDSQCLIKKESFSLKITAK